MISQNRHKQLIAELRERQEGTETDRPPIKLLSFGYFLCGNQLGHANTNRTIQSIIRRQQSFDFVHEPLSIPCLEPVNEASLEISFEDNEAIRSVY